jgi:adenine-specific DNA glycosylase
MAAGQLNLNTLFRLLLLRGFTFQLPPCYLCPVLTLALVNARRETKREPAKKKKKNLLHFKYYIFFFGSRGVL